MPQVCPAHLAEAVTLPGAWDRLGCLECWVPLPGLSTSHPTGHSQVKLFLVLWRTPRVQPLDLSPAVLGQSCKSATRSVTCGSLLELGAVPAVSWMCCCEGQNVLTPPTAGLRGQGSGRGVLVSPMGPRPPWEPWRPSGEWPARPKNASCKHPALA